MLTIKSLKSVLICYKIETISWIIKILLKISYGMKLLKSTNLLRTGFKINSLLNFKHLCTFNDEGRYLEIPKKLRLRLLSTTGREVDTSTRDS